jgi:hypothetical protein
MGAVGAAGALAVSGEKYRGMFGSLFESRAHAGANERLAMPAAPARDRVLWRIFGRLIACLCFAP